MRSGDFRLRSTEAGVRNNSIRKSTNEYSGASSGIRRLSETGLLMSRCRKSIPCIEQLRPDFGLVDSVSPKIPGAVGGQDILVTIFR